MGPITARCRPVLWMNLVTLLRTLEPAIYNTCQVNP
jgi:hypothetical protein